MKPYSLLLLSLPKVESPEGIVTSVQMMLYGLWREFSRRPYVTVRCHSVWDKADGIDPVDFVLAHQCFGDELFARLAEVKPRTKHTMLFMEFPLPVEQVDHCFAYLPFPPDVYHTEYIPCPCLADILDAHTAPKQHEHIILDHFWPKDGQHVNWNERYWEWLSPFHFTLYQLRHWADTGRQFPDFLKSIPTQSYPDYLDATATAEKFILSHQGSYEHSIVDMVYRGTRVLVPIIDGTPAAPPALIDYLKLPTFSTRRELLDLLAQPLDPGYNAKTLCTDMPTVVDRIDAYCQEVLG